MSTVFDHPVPGTEVRTTNEPWVSLQLTISNRTESSSQCLIINCTDGGSAESLREHIRKALDVRERLPGEVQLKPGLEEEKIARPGKEQNAFQTYGREAAPSEVRGRKSRSDKTWLKIGGCDGRSHRWYQVTKDGKR